MKKSPNETLVDYMSYRASLLSKEYGSKIASKYFNSKDVKDLLSWTTGNADRVVRAIINNLGKATLSSTCPWCQKGACPSCEYKKNHGSSVTNCSNDFYRYELYEKVSGTLTPQTIDRMREILKNKPRTVFKVDDRVVVKSGSCSPRRRHFSHVGDNGLFYCFADGRTSFTSEIDPVGWENCELYKEEE